MADAVARVVSAVIIGGSVVYTAHTIGGSLRGSANKLAAAVAEIADTLSNGPRRPWLLQWVIGRGDGGSEPARSHNKKKKKKSSKPDCSGSC